MRDRVKAVKKIMQVLSRKVEEKGDLDYYRKKNAELRTQLSASQKELEGMNRRIDDLQNIIEELRGIIVSGRDLPCEDKATSPLEKSQPRITSGAKGTDLRPAQRVPQEERKWAPVMRPPLKGVSALIPTRASRNFKTNIDEDAELSRQIVELVAKRKKLRQRRQEAGSSRSADLSPQAGSSQGRPLPKIVADI